MNNILYRYVVPITFVFLFFVVIVSLPSPFGQVVLSGIAGWYVGGWASDFGRWLRDKVNT